MLIKDQKSQENTQARHILQALNKVCYQES